MHAQICILQLQSLGLLLIVYQCSHLFQHTHVHTTADIHILFKVLTACPG